MVCVCLLEALSMYILGARMWSGVKGASCSWRHCSLWGLSWPLASLLPSALGLPLGLSLHSGYWDVLVTGMFQMLLECGCDLDTSGLSWRIGLGRPVVQSSAYETTPAFTSLLCWTQGVCVLCWLLTIPALRGFSCGLQEWQCFVPWGSTCALWLALMGLGKVAFAIILACFLVKESKSLPLWK